MRILILINLDNLVKKIIDALTCSADSRDNRHSEKIAKLLYIQFVSLEGQLIVHIQSHDHSKVHIDELGGKVEISLQIGCVHDIDDHIRSVFHEILPHIQFFRTIGRQRICPRKVNDSEMISSIFEKALLSIDRNAAVVTDMFVAA